MKFILIFLLNSNTFTAEFNNKAACEAAKAELKIEYKMFMPDIRCFSKGEKESKVLWVVPPKGEEWQI
jgi:hypothetical protein